LRRQAGTHADAQASDGASLEDTFLALLAEQPQAA